jgi:hypothetical protein
VVVVASQRAFFCVSALLFAASAALTIAWCESMSAMGEMPMPGGWTMSMAWMRMPGQTWPGAAASFLGMWVVMMVALAVVEMQQPALARAVPIAVGGVVLIAGALQFTAWKARHLACCRAGPGAAVLCRPTPARPGDTACASVSTAPTAVAP